MAYTPNQIATTVNQTDDSVSDDSDAQGFVDDSLADLQDIDLEDSDDYEDAFNKVNDTLSRLVLVRDYLATKVE